jgi:hypothetical protein
MHSPMKEKERKGKEMKTNQLSFSFINFSESGFFNALRVKKIEKPRPPNPFLINALNAWLAVLAATLVRFRLRKES